MKKYYYITMAAISALTISCSKNESHINGETFTNSELLTVKGVIPVETDTKTDYDIDWGNHKATFYWKGTEVFSRMGFNEYINRQEYTGTADDLGQTELTFTGGAVTGDTGYAFYPGVGSFCGLGWGTGSGYLKIAIPSTSVYDASNPIKGFIPMMGKLNTGGDTFEFTPLTGVIAIRMAKIPSEATSIKISSPNTTGGFSGNFNTHQTGANAVTGLENTYTNGFLFADCETAYRSFTFSNLGTDNTYYFYFPTPLGNLDGLKIELADATGPFYTVTSAKEVTISRGVITRLPLITVPTAPSATVTGDLNNRTANFTYNDAVKIKYAITTSSTEHLSSLTPIETTDVSAEIVPASTGTYYLVYQGYMADGTTKVGPEKRVQFIYVSNNVADVAGTYIINNSVYGFKFTIEAISPVTDGKNIKITAYDSYTNTYDSSGICSGVLNSATGTITIPSAQTLANATTTFCLIGFSGDVSTSDFNAYDDNFVLNIVAVDNDAALRFNCNKICVTEETNVNTGNKTFRSSGQHFTSDGLGYNGPVFLYKSK